MTETQRRTKLSVALIARRLLRETVIVCAGVLVYFGVRGLTEGDVSRANDNATQLVRLERDIGMFWERSLQGAVDGSHLLVSLANWVYVWGHWPLIIATLCWLAIKHPHTYLFTRNAMLLSGAVGLVIFAAFPVTPPRLFDPELVDTITEYSRSYRMLQPPAFVNQYAAMPSLHVGWDALIGIAIASYARHAMVRCLGALLPAAMVFAVILTANHYILDVVAGLALTLIIRALVARSSMRIRRPNSRRRRLTLTAARASRSLTGAPRGGDGQWQNPSREGPSQPQRQRLGGPSTTQCSSTSTASSLAPRHYMRPHGNSSLTSSSRLVPGARRTIPALRHCRRLHHVRRWPSPVPGRRRLPQVSRHRAALRRSRRPPKGWTYCGLGSDRRAPARLPRDLGPGAVEPLLDHLREAGIDSADRASGLTEARRLGALIPLPDLRHRSDQER